MLFQRPLRLPVASMQCWLPAENLPLHGGGGVRSYAEDAPASRRRPTRSDGPPTLPSSQHRRVGRGAPPDPSRCSLPQFGRSRSPTDRSCLSPVLGIGRCPGLQGVGWPHIRRSMGTWMMCSPWGRLTPPRKRSLCRPSLIGHAWHGVLLRVALIVCVGGTRPKVAPHEVAAMIESERAMAQSFFSMHPYYSENLVIFDSHANKDRVLLGGSIRSGRLLLRQWTS